MWKTWPLITLLGGLQMGSFCVKWFGSSSQNETRVNICSSHSTPRYVLKRIGNRCSNKHLHTDVLSSSMNNLLEAETTKMSISGWVGKPSVVSPQAEYHSATKREWDTDIRYHVDEPQSHSATWKKPDPTRSQWPYAVMIPPLGYVQSQQIQGDREHTSSCSWEWRGVRQGEGEWLLNG